jgi:hypothetical protein
MQTTSNYNMETWICRQNVGISAGICSKNFFGMQKHELQQAHGTRFHRAGLRDKCDCKNSSQALAKTVVATPFRAEFCAIQRRMASKYAA